MNDKAEEDLSVDLPGEVTIEAFDGALRRLAHEIVLQAAKLQRGPKNLPLRIEALKVATTYRGMTQRGNAGDDEGQGLKELRDTLDAPAEPSGNDEEE